ncbi:MAG: DUF423 domain-containing protein [Pseudomonadota bacterium]
MAHGDGLTTVSARIWLVLAGLNGAIAVAAGAMAAHVAQDAGGETVATAARYQMWHALALLAVAWISTTTRYKLANLAGCLYFAGILLFCGSLYLSVAAGWSGITMAAPFGGIAFILGWLVLLGAGIGRLRKD